MVGRVVEIAGEGRHLSLHRGFLLVRSDGVEVGRVPLDDIAAVVANAHGLTHSTNLLLALTERGIPFVLCAANHQPAAILWPVDGHHIQAGRMRAQIAARQPLVKRCWQSLVKAKIENQGAVLAALGRPAGAFDGLAARVRSGDPDNLEGQAARRYWPLLLGDGFRRDPDLPGTNGLLNYGYTILRSGTARAVMAAGLHPSLGLHHRSAVNAMALVDDLMEPFRPLADLLVVRLLDSGVSEVTPEAKRQLAALLEADLPTRLGRTPVVTCLQRLALSLAQMFETGRGAPDLPLSPLPLDLAPVESGPSTPC
ncbi:type II CRISPR-associated endonuclease Cas1 [Rhodocista pekingensis]|uniref:CRISPR-associated endonuclease Cas1 n=1 Tax=Rhodocista pekingensis TaxID=201185 RepID=A0ABW2KZX1_9PROT